ncbi:MAG: LamG domain-containing protein [Nostoc sp. DedQUE04]|uniref:LamG domain-containing protein n=1 Tax=Nostoc sp. DedQUE04 TaxID=3075390 RepID=UPI002AD4CCC8|nr:LamG domain-containing protein [Nostoc sp. DedQUE04]MDZ8136321.1 LamG domain-containing protein [Nostoc sp. DedQUE04]
MEISKLKTLTTPNLNDVLPILDINGGVSGKPILRKASLGSLLALAESDNSSEFQVPSVIKTTAESGDYFIGIDSTGTPYKISKADLLAGLSSGGSSSGSGATTTDPYFSDVVFLSHFNDLVDIKGKTITAGGNAQISTAIKKYGTGSAIFDGSGDYLSIQSSNDLNFSTGQDFTIEFFVNLSSLTSAFKVLLARSVVNSDSTFNLDINSTNIRLTGWYSVYINQPHNIVTNTWYYIAVTREGNVLKLYKDATLLGSYTGNTNFPNINNFTFGGDPLSGPGATILGNIDEARITKRARVISSVPSAAFPDS